MNFITKLKETMFSVLPIMAIVLIYGFFIIDLDTVFLLRFVVGGILLIIGLSIFLMGVEMGIQPMGEQSGAELTKKKNLLLLLSVAFVIGFIVTIAEPDIQVFAGQVKNVFNYVNKTAFTFAIAGGVGLYILLGLLRTFLNFSLKISLFILYTILFIVAIFASDNFFGIAFDSGGATTGPMTVPFIMALGLGVSIARSGDNNNSFGLTGICSVGPVIAVLIYSIIISKSGYQSTTVTEEIAHHVESTIAYNGLASSIFMPFFEISKSIMHEAFLSIAPLFVLFVIFQLTLLKMTQLQVTKMIVGFVYAFVGLGIFLIGVNGGFMQAGQALGEALGQKALSLGGIWYAILIFTGLILGAIIVCAEPAVWVLCEQVEQVSGGTIKRKTLLLFLSIGTALAIGFSLWRGVSGINLKYFIFPGYILALILMIFSPSLFTGIAFDSGGVASGPLTSTFVLSFTIGAASGGSNGNDSFGVIALVAMMPLIAIQIMGIIFKFKQRGKNEL